MAQNFNKNIGKSQPKIEMDKDSMYEKITSIVSNAKLAQKDSEVEKRLAKIIEVAEQLKKELYNY